MTCSSSDAIGRALLADTLRVADLDFPADEVTCFSVTLAPDPAGDPACILYRDGQRAGVKDFKLTSRTAHISPLFVTTAGEPFTCQRLDDMAGLTERLLQLISERTSAEPPTPHYHVQEHWMDAYGEPKAPRHDLLEAARAEASARAQHYRSTGCQVEGDPRLGYVVTQLADVCVIQYLTCHEPDCPGPVDRRGAGSANSRGSEGRNVAVA